MGAERIGWKARPNGPRKIRVKGKYRGMGLAGCIYKTGQNSSSAIVKVNADGTAELLMSIMEIGEGAWTILTQIVAETLGFRYEDVRGAAEVGMTTVQALWFRADEHPDGAEPDHQAFTQLDVLNIARRLA